MSEKLEMAKVILATLERLTARKYPPHDTIQKLNARLAELTKPEVEEKITFVPVPSIPLPAPIVQPVQPWVARMRPLRRNGLR